MKEEIKAIVVGAAGKMGARIIHVIKEILRLSSIEPLKDQITPPLGRTSERSIGLGKHR